MKQKKIDILGMVFVVVFVGFAGCMGPVDEGTTDEDDGVVRVDPAAYKGGYDAGYRVAREEFEVTRVVVAQRSDQATIDVVSGSRRSFEFNVSKEANLEYSVFQYAGPRFDLFFVDTANLARLGRGEPYEELTVCSDWHTATIQRACVVPPGVWHFVVDNTARGGVAPVADENGEATLRLKVTYAVFVEA